MARSRRLTAAIYHRGRCWTECHLLEGLWPDAPATSFEMRNGKVAEIGIGYS